MAKAVVLLVEKTDKKQLDDEQVYEVLATEVKQRRDAILEFEKGNRQDLMDAKNAEIRILLGYLPQQLNEEEISEIVRQAVNELGISSMKDIVKVMATVVPKIKGRADGRLVNQIIK